MKKRISLLGIITILAIIGFGLTACDDDENTGSTHTHIYSTSWSYNATQHYKQCSCGEKIDIENHAGSPCNVCEYGNTGSTHTHTYSTTWSSNATQHWKECTDTNCDAKTETADHQYIYTVTGTSYPAQSTPTCSICGDTGTARNTIIGDTGPAGGIIFYVASSGFHVQGYSGGTGSFAQYTAYYLEAAPANVGSSIQWGANGTIISDLPPFLSSTFIGNGRRNTQIIVNYLATTSETGTAAQVCASKTVTVGGTVFNDWFLPNLVELNEMYKAKGQTGIPTSGWFWSSSQDGYDAWFQDFNNGGQNTYYKDNYCNVRAVRAF